MTGFGRQPSTAWWWTLHDALLTIREAAALCSVHEVTVRQWISRYRLPTVKDPDDRRRTLVSERAIVETDRRTRATKGRTA